MKERKNMEERILFEYAFTDEYRLVLGYTYEYYIVLKRKRRSLDDYDFGGMILCHGALEKCMKFISEQIIKAEKENYMKFTLTEQQVGLIRDLLCELMKKQPDATTQAIIDGILDELDKEEE